MELTLTPEPEAYVAEQVPSGAFHSASDVMADAPEWKIREDDIADLRAKLRRTEEDIKTSRTVLADDAFSEDKQQLIREHCLKPTE